MKRRISRLSLTAFFGVISLICVVFAWVGALRRDAQLQDSVIAKLDAEVDFRERTGLNIVQAILPQYARDRLGDSFFQAVQHIALSGATDLELKQLEVFSTAEHVTLWFPENLTPVGIESLKQMPRLTGLYVYHTDAGFNADCLLKVCRLQKLRYVQLAVADGGSSLGAIANLSQLESIELELSNDSDQKYLRFPNSIQHIHLVVERIHAKTLIDSVVKPEVLTKLSIQSRDLDAEVYLAMARFKNLSRLILPTHAADDEGIAILKGLRQLKRIEFSNYKTY